VQLKENDLTYLVAWANTNPSLHSVTLLDFWNGGSNPEDQVTIQPAYTLKGKEILDRFFDEMDTALFDPLLAAGGKLTFRDWYKNQYLNAWENFGSRFSDGRLRLADKADRDKIIERIGNGSGPYLTFLSRLTEEMGPYRDDPEHPWIPLAYAFKDAREEAARKESLSKTAGLLTKATQKGKNLIDKVERKVGSAGEAELVEARMTAATAAGDYQRALTGLAKAVSTRKGAFEVATAAFSEEAAGGAGPDQSPALFQASEKALRTLETALPSGGAQADLFWKLAAGPQQFLLNVACQESACHLAKLWEDTVLLDIQGIRGKKEINDAALGSQGPVTALITGPAAPFIDRSLEKGYFARSLLGKQLPFKGDFFTYLTKGTRAAKPSSSGSQAAFNATVTIRAMPTDVNQDASIRPHATNLEVTCGGQVSSLINLNYPVRKTFTWSPATCGETTFSIDVGRLVLTRKYTGNLGFARFLADFNQGEKRFYPNDFPEQRRSLERMNIKYIQINYKFSGHWPVVDYYHKSTAVPDVPRTIVTCWDQ
jgi:type VI secretion system protein ImpL